MNVDSGAELPDRPPTASRLGLFPLWIFVVVVVAVVLMAYGWDVGTAFIKEDANWIMRSRIRGLSDVTRLITDTGGFFRPVVGLSFAVNYWLFGGHPAGYGWTNLLLVLGIAAGLNRLARVLGLTSGASIVAAALWILNFHGINMSVLWLSGRTALLLSLFSVLAAIAAARERYLAMFVCALLAMSSKEEGVLLPLILVGVLWLRSAGPPSRKRFIGAIVTLLVVWLVYFGTRSASDAYTPARAPAFYTFRADPGHVLDNALEYADRALTLSAAGMLLTLAFGRVRVTLAPCEWRLVALGGLWLIAGFALTVLLPTRSSLYAVFPSIGGAFAAAVVTGHAWNRMPAGRQRPLAALALILPLALVPVYWQRNERWTELADVSKRTVAAFAELAPAAPEPWHVIIVDDHSTRANVASALAWGLTDTVQLVTGRRPHVWIVPPPPDINPWEIVTSPPKANAILELREGRVVRLPLNSLDPARAGEYW